MNFLFLSVNVIDSKDFFPSRISIKSLSCFSQEIINHLLFWVSKPIKKAY